MASQIITDCGNFTLDFKQHGLCTSHSSSRLSDLDFQIKCTINFLMKRGLWTTEQQSQFIFSLAQVRCFWRCFSFRSGLVALFLKMSECGDSWFSFSSLLVKLSQVFESALVDSILKLAVIPVACAPFPNNFFLPVNFAFNMLWYSTPWTATPFSNDPLWFTLFVEGVNDCLLDHCQVSSVPHYCGFKEQEISGIYL